MYNLKIGLWAALKKIREDPSIGSVLIKMLFVQSLPKRERQAFRLIEERKLVRGVDLAKEMGIELNHARNITRALRNIGCVRKVRGGYELNE